MVKELESTTFKESIAKGVSLVDFWAEWCGPCVQQGPIVEELAEAVGEEFTIGKLDVDKNKETAIDYEVTSIPTLIVFKDGEPVKRLVGLHPLNILKEALTSAQTSA